MTKHELGKHIENILDKGDKISIFERNILAISTYSATLAKELLEIKENKNFNVYMGADPLALNIINTKNYEYLYKNPLDDVTKQINEFEKKYARYLALFIYGLGNGVLIKSLLANDSHKRIIVFEPEIEIIFIVLNLIDFSIDLHQNRLVIAHSSVFSPSHYYAIARMDEVLSSAKLYDLYINCPYYLSYKNDMLKVNRFMNDAIKQCIQEIGNDCTDALTGINQTTKNIPQMLKNLAISSIIKARKNKVKSAIIVSTGPSLAKQLPLLKKVREHASVICVDASYPILKKEGIVPDYVVSIERVPATSKFYNSTPNEFDKDIIFVISSLMHEDTVATMEGRNVSYTMRPLNYERGFKDKDFGYMGSGPSAAHLGFDLALALGHKKAILIGQDLAFGDNGTSHSKGHIFTERETDIEKTNIELAPKYGGKGFVKTNACWNLFRRYFENLAMLHRKQIKLYNCTEGGARISGVEEKPFEKLVEIILKEPKKHLKAIKPLSQKRQAAKLQRYQKHIKSTLRYGQNLQKRVEKLFSALVKEIEKVKLLKQQGKENKINYTRLQAFSDKVDVIKDSLSDKRFLSSYFTICGAALKHKDLDFAKLVVRQADTYEQKCEKLYEWVCLQAHWLFTIAGYIDVTNENILNQSKEWLEK